MNSDFRHKFGSFLSTFTVCSLIIVASLARDFAEIKFRLSCDKAKTSQIASVEKLLKRH